MSQLAQHLAKELLSGLSAVGQSVGNTLVNDVLPDITTQASRTLSHGASEMAAALHSGNAFVLYGHGQSASQPEREAGQEQEKAHEQERGGMER